MANGNGEQPTLQIDVTDEHAFRTGVVQNLQLLADRTYCLNDIKRKVERHENIIRFGKWASVPAVIFFSEGIKEAAKYVATMWRH
jgi:hypothetical protein